MEYALGLSNRSTMGISDLPFVKKEKKIDNMKYLSWQKQTKQKHNKKKIYKKINQISTQLWNTNLVYTILSPFVQNFLT